MATEYPFRWATRRVPHPYVPTRMGARATQYTLICNACDESILRGVPCNGPGRRYFVHMAINDAREHLKDCAANRIGRLQQ